MGYFSLYDARSPAPDPCGSDQKVWQLPGSLVISVMDDCHRDDYTICNLDVTSIYGIYGHSYDDDVMLTIEMTIHLNLNYSADYYN